jgi:cytochrome c biogenesis protein CcdA
MFILLPIAFVSGLLTVFSPCVLPILPIILASGIDGKTKRIKGIITGLVVSFTLASLLLVTFVRMFGISADLIRDMAVFLLLIIGLNLVFPELWTKIQRNIEKYWRIQPVQKVDDTFLGGFATGVSLGIVWTPCVGPVLATVATLSATQTVTMSTFFITLSYAFGVSAPLYFIAKSGTSLSNRLGFVKKHNQNIRQMFGIVILFTALAMVSGFDRSLQAWTLNALPQSWTQIGTEFESKLNVNQLLKSIKIK